RGPGERKEVQGLAQTDFGLEVKGWQDDRKNGIEGRNFFGYQYDGDSATRDYEAVADGTPPPSHSHPTLSRRCSPRSAAVYTLVARTFRLPATHWVSLLFFKDL